MVNINKKYLDKNLKEKAWDILLKRIKSGKSADNLEKNLTRWLTPKEVVMLEKRLAISYLLFNGVRHNEIKRILDVSSHTITFVKRKFKRRL